MQFIYSFLGPSTLRDTNYSLKASSASISEAPDTDKGVGFEKKSKPFNGDYSNDNEKEKIITDDIVEMQEMKLHIDDKI